METGIRAVTVIVDEPSAVAGRLAAAFGWEVTQDFGAFAEVRDGDSTIVWLNIPSEPTTEVQQGVILHSWVEDVAGAAETAREAGAEILREPTTMDYGMVSAWARVAGGPIVDLTRPV